ncbi:MAG: autotransporter-associated beta strand repeat-containing protein [Chthoniobacteraceae bacterium]
MLLDPAGTGSFTISSAADHRIVLSGLDPLVSLLRRGGNITSPLVLDASSGKTTLRNQGLDDLAINGAISEAAPNQSLAIDATPADSHPRSIVLNGANTFTGGVTLLGGRLVLGNVAALGAGVLTAKNGTLQIGSAIAIPNDIKLDGTLTLTSADGAVLSGVIAGGTASAGLVLRNDDVTLALTGNSTYTGPTIVDYTPVPNSTFAGGTLRLTGGGSIAASSAVEVRAGGTLEIDAQAGGSNRVGDSTSITLRDGKLIFRGIANADIQTETIGALQSSGHSRVTLMPVTGGGSLRLMAASLERLDRGTFEIYGQGLGGSFSSGNANLTLSSAPAGMVGGGGQGAQTSILPYAIGGAPGVSNGGSFLTWNAETGVRPLDTATEYVNSITAAVEISNVRLTASVDHGGSKSINALVLAGGSINGSGTLTVTSGGILQSGLSVTSIRPSLNFGLAEANIFVDQSLTLLGSITGGNGLTKSGSGALTINAINTVSGPLTINDGIVTFALPAQLGLDDSPIVFGGTGAGLSYTGNTALNLGRPIHLQTGTGRVIVGSASSRVTLSGNISGPGGLSIDRPGSHSTLRTIALTGTNTYTGPTRVYKTVDLEIASDAALGNGGALELMSRSKLSLAGDWETDRLVALVPSTPAEAAVKIDTREHTATLNGPLTGSREGLEKLGTGTLRLAGDARTLQGRVMVRAGEFALSDKGATGVNTWNLLSGTRLVLDNTGVPLSYRGGASFPLVQLEGASYELKGNAAVPVTEQIGVGMRGTSTMHIAPVGNAGVFVRIGVLSHMSPDTHTDMPEPGTELLIRATNLGAAPTGAFSRITANIINSRSGSPDGYGFVPNVYFADPADGQVTSLAFYDKATDSAGEIGFRPLRADEYSTGVMANPGNGGDTSTGAHAFATEEMTVQGGLNTVASITLEPGGEVILDDAQKLTVSSGTLLALPGGSASGVVGGTLDLGAHRSAIYTAGNLEISSDIIGSGTLVKAGVGVLSLAGAVNLGGEIEVDRGSLRLQEGAQLIGPVLVNTAGQIAGTGKFAGEVSISGMLSPGDQQPGTLQFEQLSFLSGANVHLDLGSAAEFDRIVAQSVTMAGTLNLVLDLGVGLSSMASFQILENLGASSMASFRFTHEGKVLNEGDKFIASAQEFRITYAGGTGNDVVLSAVPEPGASSLLAMGALLLSRRRRRR